MNFNHEIDDSDPVQLRAIIKDLKSELTRYKLMSNTYQKYFNFFTQINEIIVSKKSEVLDVIKDIQSFNDLNPKKSFVSPKDLSENDFNERNTESNEQNSNESQERDESTESEISYNFDLIYENNEIISQNKCLEEGKDKQIMNEKNTIEDNQSMTTVVPIKCEQISDVEEYSDVEEDYSDVEASDNSVPKSNGVEYLTNVLNINVGSEESPNQPIVSNETQSEDIAEEVSNESQLTIDNIGCLRSYPISGKPKDSTTQLKTDIKGMTRRTKQRNPIFRCNECSAVMKTYNSYLRHTNTHSSRYLCGVEGCPYRAGDNHNLLRHKSQKHSNKEFPKKSIKSTESYNKSNELNDNRVEANPQNPRKDNKLLKYIRFQSFDSVMTRNKRLGKYLCKIDGCEYRAGQLCNLLRHKGIVHSKHRPLRRSPQYKPHSALNEEMSLDLRRLRKGINSKIDVFNDKPVVPLNEFTFECDFNDCDKSFSDKYKLNSHKRSTHLKEKRFECDYKDCDKSFFTKEHLNQHQRIHSGEKPFVCDEHNCGKRFNQPANLMRHKRIHSGDKPFVCDHNSCGKRFIQKSHLNNHIKTHFK